MLQEKLANQTLNDEKVVTDDQVKLTKEEVNYIYNLGVRQFEVGNYEKATLLFQFVISCDSKNALFFKALAGCLHACEDFMGAFLNYQMAYILDAKTNSDCLFYCGVCMYELDNLDTAKKSFEEFLLSSPSDDKLLPKTNMYLKAINNKQIN